MDRQPLESAVCPVCKVRRFFRQFPFTFSAMPRYCSFCLEPFGTITPLLSGSILQLDLFGQTVPCRLNEHLRSFLRNHRPRLGPLRRWKRSRRIRRIRTVTPAYRTRVSLKFEFRPVLQILRLIIFKHHRISPHDHLSTHTC